MPRRTITHHHHQRAATSWVAVVLATLMVLANNSGIVVSGMVAAAAAAASTELEDSSHGHSFSGHDGLLHDAFFFGDGSDYFKQQHQPQQRHLQNPVFVEECSDAIDWFVTDTAEAFRSYFDCECSSPDNNSDSDNGLVLRPSETFVLTCSLQNYCFDASNLDGINATLGSSIADEQQEAPTEECLSMRFSTRFVLGEDGQIYDALDGGSTGCVDYHRGLGEVCWRSQDACRLILENEGFSNRRRREICGNATACTETMPEYTDLSPSEICPEVTLGGSACRSNGYGYEIVDECQETQQALFDKNIDVMVGVTPDCTNVEPCAEASCWYSPVIEDGGLFGSSWLVQDALAKGYPGCRSTSSASANASHGSTSAVLLLSGLVATLACLM